MLILMEARRKINSLVVIVSRQNLNKIYLVKSYFLLQIHEINKQTFIQIRTP